MSKKGLLSATRAKQLSEENKETELDKEITEIDTAIRLATTKPSTSILRGRVSKEAQEILKTAGFEVQLNNDETDYIISWH
tara:strand:+ start:516 stop:758 length:243 start_codon:yes stop_codon:yes gene_type:complete